jgi:hypothetical protein
MRAHWGAVQWIALVAKQTKAPIFVHAITTTETQVPFPKRSDCTSMQKTLCLT